MHKHRKSGRHSGSGLIGVLVGVGIFGILSVAMSTLFTDMFKSQNVARAKNEVEAFHEELRTHFSSRQACLNTFAPLGPYTNGMTAPVTSIKNAEASPATPTERFNTVANYGTGTFKIDAMSVTYADDPVVAGRGEATLTIKYRPQIMTLGPQTFADKQIIMTVTKNVSNALTDCLPKAKTTDGIWNRVGTSDIQYSGGNVGVGEPVPANRLHVRGPNMTSFQGANAGTVRIDAPFGPSGNQYRSIDFGYDGNPRATARIASLHNGSGSALQFGTSNNFTNGITNTAMTITNIGRVGIGTDAPADLLHVEGSTRVEGRFRIGDPNAAGEQITIRGNGPDVGYIGWRDAMTNDRIAYLGPVFSGGYANLRINSEWYGIQFRTQQVNSAFLDSTVFRVGTGAAGGFLVDLNANLDVQGTARVGNLPVASNRAVCVQTGGVLSDCNGAPSDLAEWYETSGDAEPGDLVMMTPEHFSFPYDVVDPIKQMETGEKASSRISVLSKAVQSHSPMLFGVVSFSPGQIMGDALLKTGKHPRPIALAGRVPVKISAEGGPIKVGDPITISSLPGTGMKATTTSWIVGYALEDGAGRDKIEVFVSKQLWIPESERHVKPIVDDLQNKLKKLEDRLDTLEKRFSKLSQ